MRFSLTLSAVDEKGVKTEMSQGFSQYFDIDRGDSKKPIQIMHAETHTHTHTHTHQLFFWALSHPSPAAQDLRPGHCENEFILFKEVNMKTILANDISSLV